MNQLFKLARTLFKNHLKQTLIGLLIFALLVTSLCIVSVSFTKSRMVQFGLRNIGELATQAGYYTNVQVIENAKELFGVQIPLTHSKYIFSYDGVIKAGLDFEDIDISVNDVQKTITVTLPEMKILSNELSPEGMEIYDESRSVFSPLKLDDMNQSMISLKAEAEEKALGNGLLESARANAELLITGMLLGQHGAEYTIVFSDAEVK